MLFIYLLLGVLLLMTVGYFALERHLTNHRPKYFPTKTSVPAAAANNKTIVVCAGDSITHGNVGINYVDMLERWLGDKRFFYNAGVNSDLTFTLLKRLDDIIATKPDIVTVLIGTNDVNATVDNEALKRYKKNKKIVGNEILNIDSFQANYRAIIHRLKTETQARIAVLSLPVMGEDLSNEANQKADKYSVCIKQIADSEDIVYLPLRERMQTFIKEHPKNLTYQYKDTNGLIIKSILKNRFLGHSWDKIAMANGHDLTHDNLHFNTRGGAMIASLIEDFILDR
jgi:lysophospholipase L1-like esterase